MEIQGSQLPLDRNSFNTKEVGQKASAEAEARIKQREAQEVQKRTDVQAQQSEAVQRERQIQEEVDKTYSGKNVDLFG